MKFQTIAPWWLVLSIGLVLCGLLAWQLYLTRRDKRLRLAWVRRLCCMVLLLLMALGPSIPGGTSPAGMTNLDVVFAVDTTTSMGALDYGAKKQERLDGAKQDIQGIAEAMAGARFGIITFDSEVKTILPMTTDISSVTSALDGMVREVSTYSKGSSIDLPLKPLEQKFKDNKKQDSQRPQILFYLSDGEQTVSKQPASFAPLKAYVSGGAILGYGTAAGGEMKTFYGFRDNDDCATGEQTFNCYVEDLDGKHILSKIDEKNLNAIASAVGIPYQNRNNGGSFKDLVGTSHAQRVADDTRAISSYTSLYYVFAFPLALLAAWELWYIRSRLREITPGKAGSA